MEDMKDTTIVFHVHIPAGIEKLGGYPVVIGDGSELGDWEHNTVKLYKPSNNNPTYWRSNDTKITFSKKSKIHYNYAIYIPAAIFRRPKKIIYEGQNSSDESLPDSGKRLLNLNLRRQFDKWINGNCPELEQCQIGEDIPDYAFVDYIYNNITSDNLKESVLEYQLLLTLHTDLTIKFSDHEYIINNINENSKREQKLFLCLLLGYHISRQDSFILTEDFKSEILIDVLTDFQKSILPLNVNKFMFKAILRLAQHNAFQYKFGWLMIFKIAKEIDPTYVFLRILEDLNYTCSDFKRFSEEMKKMELCINDIGYENTVKIAKWLVKLCKDIESLIEAWNNPLMISKQLDSQILQCFIERIQELISKDDVNVLTSRSQELQEFKGSVSIAVRNQALSLLKDPMRVWSRLNAYGMLNLLQDDSLNWSSDDVIISLELLSQSHSLELLTIFPVLLDYWFNRGFSDSKEKNIPNISKNWFVKILSMDGGNLNEIFVIFRRLDAICPLLGCRKNIWKNLINIVAKKMETYSEFQIINAIKFVSQIETQEVKELYSNIIKEILSKTVQQIDDQLINKILMICFCESKSSLVIPNTMCEDIVNYIITRLRDQSLLPESGDSEQYLNVIQSIGHSKFWFLILNATGSVEKLFANSYVQGLHIPNLKFNGLLLTKTINMRLLQQLLKYSDDKIFQYFYNTIDREPTLVVSQEIIVEIRKLYDDHNNKLDILIRFYNEFGSTHRVSDVNNYIHDIQQRKENLDEVKLNQVLLPNYWAYHEETLDIAEQYHKFIKSQTFRNIFEVNFQKDSDASKVKYITQKLLPAIFKNYGSMCKKYETWGKISCSEALLFWKNVKNINAEFDLIEEFGSCKGNQRLIQTLECLLKFPQWAKRLGYLEKLLKIFQIECNESDQLLKCIYIIKDDSLTLDQVIPFIKNLEENFSDNEDYWNLMKELSNTEDLIRSISKHNIENLYYANDDDLSNGVSDQYITTLPFIQVKQALYPLINKHDVMNADDFMKELSTIIEKNSALSVNIIFCNSNNMVLQDLCYKIINREQDTKEKIKNAIDNGTYIFVCDEKKDECMVTLKYTSYMYNFNDILDLYKIAFLITADYVNDFVEFIDNTQKIVNILTKLMQRGHFDYQKFETKIKGVENMKEFLISLNNDLEKWDNIKNQVQENCYHSTFFTAHHIFAFYNYFTSEVVDEKNKDVCRTLIKFVNSNAQLPSHRKVEEVSCDSYDYFSKIGTKLENIFRNIPKQRREIKIIQQQVITDDDVISDGSFIVAYDNKLLVPNIIMSLYVNNGYYPESWQLLLCTSSTTMEELTIFIKRCFFASDNGYDNNLFCIVNLELLNFELQYSLINHVKEMQLKNSNKNYLLALLCHRELEISQYILEQHTLDVREISGLNAEMMQEIYQELCPNLLCVTSDLSGQGKTEWIKESSFSKQKIPHSFLISDDMNFEYLMNKLKECKLKEIESLHITILPIDYPESVNLFLFELLTFKTVSYKELIVSIPQTFIYIEIASSVNQNCLPSMLRFLPFEHLSWNIENFKASQEIFSPLQIVCHYLKLYDYRKIDKKEILFNTSDVIKYPISTELCQNLIIRYFFNGEIISSFRNIEIFINVLADQLIRLSSNDYFTINNLGEESIVRSIIVKSLIQVSKDFATKFKADQPTSIIDDKSDIISQCNNLSNINIMFFNPLESNSFTILYQDKDKIPDSIKLLLLNIQAISGAMDDYNTMFTNEFLTRLEGLTCKNSTQKSEYVLSSDNLIKMALILLRVNANIPVVICGEAGCGKTSLIAHLALMIKVQYQSLNLYDGVEEETIMKFMLEALNKSEKEEIWLLFDEINTCNHLGLLADLISNRMFQGKPISSNIRLFATCNPYRSRVQNEDGRVKNVKKYKERGDLIYQVKPLPEQISDYIWNYDVLKPKDEYKYIQIMVKNELKELAQPVLVELIFASQDFIRKVEEPYSVSLRDVKRVITLVKFFYNSLNNRPAYKIEHKYPSDENPALINRSYVLALSICYHSRLCEQDLRKQYCYEIGQIFQTHKNFMGEKIFIKIIREEQVDYINRMQIPNNIVKNEALLENILVMTVCILTKIPIFVIGETGSSKSLALRLISSNLRGSESDDDYFKSLPKVHIVPYLCSSSSTSNGITKIFEKANKYQETSSDVINVVLLDHVGFAESNSSNLLNLLHALLEPIYPATGPTVSFVGLSNWHLDISKSSRAILVQRPKFDLDDLVDINTKFIKFNEAEASKSLAEAYLEYKQHNQTLPNFYGLRDYYALLKMLSLAKLTSTENIQIALARNFGGIENNVKLYKLWEKYFGNFIKAFTDNNSWLYKQIPITQLIESNLNDSNARNLMVIGKSGTIINLLTDQLKRRNMDPIVILGSYFPDDKDDYSSKVLSKIMTCISTGKPLILTNLEKIYVNLYNIWNQNNIVENTEQKAYEENSNFAYHISLKCECIVVLDEKNLCSADPSFLNRFEKQKLSIGDLLNEKQQSFVQQLNDWVERISTFEDGSYKFVQKDLFIGFDSDETLQSLVLDITNNYAYTDDSEILENCKKRLITLATSDGIVRAERLILNPSEIDQLKCIYYIQHHESIYDYFENLFDQEDSSEYSKKRLMIINTFSHINTDIKSCLSNLTTCQAYKLSNLKSEAQLSNLVKRFYLKSNDQILILQRDKFVSIECINLAKFIIEQFQNENLDKKEQIETNMPIKYVCIINHIQRGCDQNLILSNFIHEWKQITIESLEQQNISLNQLLNKSLYDIVNSDLFSKMICSSTPFEKILEDELLWCLSCIGYQISNECYNDYIRTLNIEILDNAYFIQCIKEKVYKWISENCNDWQFEVAKNQDYLSQFTSLLLASQNYVKMIVKHTIAKILYSLEKLLVTKTYFTFEKIDDDEIKAELSGFWKRCFMDNTIININNLPEPKTSKYIMSYYVIDELKFPFSYYFFNQINSYKLYYDEELDILKQDLNNIDEKSNELHIDLIENHIEKFKNKLLSARSNFRILQKYSELYYNDFIRILSNRIKKLNHVKELDFIIKHIIGDKIVSSPFLLHIYWWNHAESILIQLQLIEMFPTTFEKAQKDFIIYGMLDQFLFNEAINFILQKIYYNEECEKEMDIVLSLVNRMNDTKKLTNLPLLQICNELLKIKLIPLEKIKEMINLGRARRQEFITIEIIELVLYILDNNNDLTVTNIRSFIMKCLEIIPLESEVRLTLYRNLFLQKPFNLTNEIIEKIFIDEIQQNDEIFFTLINNSKQVLQHSIRLNVINNCLNDNNLNTNIGELCCEIIQAIFGKFELKKLISYFPNFIEDTTENSALQHITVIAFLKEFTVKFWKDYMQDENSLPESSIKMINEYVKIKHPLVQSFKSYFLFKQKRFSVNTNQFKIISNKFPWIENDSNEKIPYYSKFWRMIRQVNFEDFHTFYNNNLDNCINYPFLLVYIKYYERIKLVKYLYPIVKFVKILNSKLEYRKSRKSAQMMTFHEFIEEESKDNAVNGDYLKSLFEGFALSWNSVINYIGQYRSKELSNKPFMNLKCSVIYGLIEQKDAGVYLCAILEFLIKMHNEFLDNVFSIPVEQCKSLKFLEHLLLPCNNPAYFTKSIMITQAQEINFINYELDEKILKYSQINLDQKDEVSFNFNLQQIEMLLMRELVIDKVYFEKGNNQFYFEDFSFKHEIFHNTPRIFFSVREVLQQEPIQTDKIKSFLVALQPSNSFISELLLIFEIILCFIKELAINNNEILIEDFIRQWSKLSRYNMMLTDICEEFSEFSLKHIIELYELIEQQDADLFNNTIIHNIDDKFKIPLEEQMKESINDCIDYYNQSESKISAKVFALALRRFIYRFLLIDSNIENLNLTDYFLDFTLNFWPNYIKEELVEKLFPTCLLVSHAYSCYIFINEEIEKIKEKQNKEKKSKFKL